jgi:type I restriction enzyme R subunit
MAEYTNVEKPFLEKLRQVGWQVYDKGQGILENPGDSFRTSFKEVILKGIFLESIKKINDWITPAQLEYCFDRISNQGPKKLLEANKSVYTALVKGITLPGKNERTGEENPTVHLVDFTPKGITRNSFIALNQFRVDTPNTAKVFIIPDIVCFVNGLPLVVVECKDLYVAEPLSDAFTQIKRYSNQRDDYYSSNEGEERLFHTNLFSVITHGSEARFGTITSDFDYFYNWNDIFPEEYKTITVEPNSIRQEVMIHGMFNHAILLDILKNFIFFTALKSGEEIKIVCRYQQYRAVGKMIERLRIGKNWKQRSGVVWHTQGSGKSLTMAFLVKKMRSCFDLKDYKILMIVDRLDLEEQLLETAALAEIPRRIDHKQQLVLLNNDTANLNMVMIHKFGVNQEVSVESLLRIGIIPKFETFQEISNSEKILMLIDEAHRSQGGDMADNLFMAFPNATRIGFTGTPLITERHRIKTSERFCQPKDEYIDTYKMNNAVIDRATVDIKYIGKSTADKIRDKEVFDLEYEHIFKNRTEAERQEIQRRYGDMIAFLESMERVQEVAADVLKHYIRVY